VCAALRDESAGAVDLAVAADVLCYISDLHPFLAAGAKKKFSKASGLLPDIYSTKSQITVNISVSSFFLLSVCEAKKNEKSTLTIHY
jgi:predicted TPR repeat methyltransferase